MKLNNAFSRRWAYGMICCCLLLAGVIACAQQQAGRPNIIIIYADDLGYGDLSSYGGDIPTPHIDRIGREGIRFTDFYVAAPVCTPSRFGLLTGTYPNRSMHRLQNVLFPADTGRLDPSEKTLAEWLKEAGYATALVGKWHLGSAVPEALPTHHGFDRFDGFKGGCIDFFYHTYGKLGLDWHVNGDLRQEEGFATDLLTRHALEYIDATKNSGKPFFLFLSHNAPHYGKSDPDSLPPNTVTLVNNQYQGIPVANTLQAPAEYVERFKHVADPYRKTYSAMVSSLDDNIGILLDKLEKDGLLDNTMIWFISDNGGYSETLHSHASNGILRGQKGSVWEGGIRVPALVRWGERIKPGQEIRTPVINMDLLPTIAGLLGFRHRLNHVDGVDIRELLFEGKPIQRDLFWKFNKQSAIRSGDWKLVNRTELFNLRVDPSERHDLAEKHPDIVQELQRRYQQIENTLPAPPTGSGGVAARP